jgi:formylglycine-generating enzyme required for sulfatase activity
LPTEAEWEFACRAGTSTSRYYGDTLAWLDRYAVFRTTAAIELLPVGTRKPNDFGLFDMLGNVAEWCQDSYQPTPTGENTATGKDIVIDEQVGKVIRGGSAGDAAERVRSAARDPIQPGRLGPTIGFRVARSNL